MFNLIFLIVIIIVLRNVIEKSRSGHGKDAGQNSAARAWNESAQKTGSAAGYGISSTASKAAPQLSKPGTSGGQASLTGSKASASGSVSHRAASKAAAGKKTETAQAAFGSDAFPAAEEAEQISTTEYLRQKALEDQKEHEEAARMEALRLHRETGGRMAAQRHYDGDSIPRGMRLVKCSYCGAENLIGDYQKQNDFTCYFCREIL